MFNKINQYNYFSIVSLNEWCRLLSMNIIIVIILFFVLTLKQSRSYFHILKWAILHFPAKWNHIEDLDTFFTRLYTYHQVIVYVIGMLNSLLSILNFNSGIWLIF